MMFQKLHFLSWPMGNALNRCMISTGVPCSAPRLADSVCSTVGISTPKREAGKNTSPIFQLFLNLLTVGGPRDEGIRFGPG
ncbi:hypothetical protein FKM82_013358 [Ascaphus truei]